ncbi:beta-propeller fold lactonase family protein [Pelagicoccus mobilis]|uniref:Beta-propeller fold lactonase family protein n=1 Tax=Pelagicoccus mobilis TaxID=415221 RepID=A0A934RYG8_9BACT|nr:beta-propeller fold lactonase family protein [Pelagicoccus mobilis]MBK1878668.1 beta-propeller fold lactonase family protein [Pelagicoccus mobilis]
MRLIFPICPFWFRSAICLLFAVIAGGLASAQEGEGGEEEEEPEVEVIKQLVFIEQHFEEVGIMEGLNAPYDVEVAPDGGHVYVASFSRHAISYFSRNEVDGELSYVGLANEESIGEDALRGVKSLAVSPDGEFVYGVSQLSDSLASFSRNLTTGELSFVHAIYDTDGGVDGLDGARSVVVSPDGKNLYAAAFDDNKLSVFSRNTTTGVASFLGVYEEGDQGVEELTDPHVLALSPDGKHLYVALWSNEIVVFSRDSSTGLLSYLSKVAYLTGESKDESPRDLTFSPDGKFAYVVSVNNDAMSVFSRDAETGALTLDGNISDGNGGVSDLDGPHAISMSSDGAYIYVAAFGSDSVTSFERNSETGQATYYQSIHPEVGDEWSMNAPLAIGTSPDGEHVYVGASFSGSSVVTFRREVLVDPPELVVQPADQSIEEGEDVAFYALAQGVDLSYQWLRDGVPMGGETLPVLTLPNISSGDDGSTFSIRVSNPGGVLTSPAVDLTVLPPVVVNAPLDLTALDISSNSARLVWSDESDNETNFEVQRRSPGGEFSNLATVVENQSQYDDETLESSTTYIYRVRAKRNENASLWSNDAVIESFDDVPQGPVNLNVVEEHYNRVELRWSDRSAVEDGFLIVRRKDEFGAVWSTVAAVDKNVTTYLDRSVDAQATYAYRLQAYNESGSSAYSNSVVAITGTNPVDTITPASRTIDPEAQSGYTISVTSTEDWEAISEVDWLIVTGPSDGKGSGNEGVVYRSRLNESQEDRTGEIIVGGMVHTVVQEGSPPFLNVSPSLTEVDAEAGTAIIDIESNVDWSASESSDWIEISSGETGSGHGSVVVNYDANEAFDSRIAELSINSPAFDSRAHTIEQAGKVPTLDLELDQSRFDSMGGSGTLSVSSNVDWTASVSVSWITLGETTSGNGDGSVSFSVEENGTGEVRSTDLLVNDKAITITQDPPLESDVMEPEWVRATVGNLGVELVWLDQSDDELGFRIRRKVVGSERSVEVAELDAGSTRFFDRDAPRGTRVEYALVAFDGIGESDEVKTTTDLIPESNMTSFALRVEAERFTKAFCAGISLAGDGEIVLQLEGAGTEFEKLNFGRRYPSARYDLDSDTSQFSSIGEVPEMDWDTHFSLAEVLGANGFDENSENVRYAAKSISGGRAYPRGGRALGQLLAGDSVISVGFDIEGEIEIPVLIQGVGETLERKGVSPTAENLQVTLYEVPESGAPFVLASNDNWQDWPTETSVTVEDAVSQTGATAQLAGNGEEARILLMLGSGRYVVILESLSGSIGSASLEVFDAR